MPPVDADLEVFVEMLLQAVNKKKADNPDLVKPFPAKHAEKLLSVLKSSFSAIFQASSKAFEKAASAQGVPEVSWRHDHDRLLFDFFRHIIIESGSLSAESPSVAVFDPTVTMPDHMRSRPS